MRTYPRTAIKLWSKYLIALMSPIIYGSRKRGALQAAKNSLIFRALWGHQIIAGGNAPGKRNVHSPTLKGSHHPVPRDAGLTGRHRDSTLSGSDLIGRTFSGGVAPGYYIDPLRGSRMDSADKFFRQPV